MAEPAMTLLIIIHLVGPIWEWPMTGMVECNVMAAGLERSDRLLYCINVAAGYTPLVDYSPGRPDDMPAFSLPTPHSLEKIQPIPPSRIELFREHIHRIEK